MQKEWRHFIQRVDYTSSPARCAFKKASAPWQNERALILRFACSFRKGVEAAGHHEHVTRRVDRDTARPWSPTALTCAACATSDTWRAGGCRKSVRPLTVRRRCTTGASGQSWRRLVAAKGRDCGSPSRAHNQVWPFMRSCGPQLMKPGPSNRSGHAQAREPSQVPVRRGGAPAPHTAPTLPHRCVRHRRPRRII